MLSVSKPVAPVSLVQTLTALDWIIPTASGAQSAGVESLDYGPSLISGDGPFFVVILNCVSLRGSSNLGDIGSVYRGSRVCLIVVVSI